MAKNWKVVSGVEDMERLGHASPITWDDIEPEIPWIAWLGHACFLIRWRGLSIVVDPVFKKWLGLMPRRLPIPDLSKLEGLDAALISHGHMDHLDSGTLRRLAPEKIFIPRKTIGFLSRDLKKCSRGLAMGDQFSIGGLTVDVVAAKHGGWRYPWQRGYVACGFVLSDGTRAVYVTGDSAYGPHFREVGLSRNIDVALLPIGAYSPQWFLQKRHMNPEEACQAACDLGAKEVIPFHFGTYRLSLETVREPADRFIEAAKGQPWRWRLPYWF
ncbi:MBL fold metallo-hydrolase [Pelagicoccus albus]|uniref:MBL fold metallo-hydrolase n=1 Tax=Pelagicoccus albus TaxID=415222 RepID=A0A7X1EAU4_9BACT|nr:MBL fold metallo-hydrolase [Pelagicoccus albus]MBC2607117.1 MBL fold metallo-hydrolase [Pelagicoccus albus]